MQETDALSVSNFPLFRARKRLAWLVPALVAAVNRYFGYVLVRDVRLSAEPFTPGSAGRRHKDGQPSQSAIAKVGAAIRGIEDDDLREALRTLGLALSSRSEHKGG